MNGIPYRAFLGQFLMKTGSFLIMDSIDVEYDPNTRRELRVWAGDPTAAVPEDIDVAAWDVYDSETRYTAMAVMHVKVRAL